VDGLATGVQRPAGWANQKVLYDAKRRGHTAQGIAVSTLHGDLLWADGGWPGSCHEQELLRVSGIATVLDATRVTALVDRGFRGMPAAGRSGTHRSETDAPRTGSATLNAITTASRQGYARWWSSPSATSATRGRCAAGAGCCTASATFTGQPPR
jgi:DDE superfamily endonuclease